MHWIISATFLLKTRRGFYITISYNKFKEAYEHNFEFEIGDRFL